MRHMLYCNTTGWLGSAGLLPLRLVMGSALLLHGWPKIQSPFDWMGADAPFPGILLALAALAEFGGGAAFLLGLLTRLGAFGIMGVMVVAVGMVHIPMGHPFVGQPAAPSYELAAVYLACAILFFVLGPGRLSLDALLFRERRESEEQRDGLAHKQ